MSQTPGPWWVEHGNVGAEHPLFVVAPGHDGFRPWSDEDAHLIAAAPELLAALKLIWSMFDDGRVVRNINNDGKPGWALRMLEFTRELQTVDSAIAKAEGRLDPSREGAE